MSIKQTRAFFSPKVQAVLRTNRKFSEADWADVCYRYLIAVDDRNIDVSIRLQYMGDMWSYLCGLANLVSFPPIGSHLRKYDPTENKFMDGLPSDLVEATLAGIQARVQLYGTCSGGYAARAISSIDVENFHSVLNRQHHHGGEMASLYEVQGSMSHIVVATKIKKEAMFRNLLEIRDEDSHYPLPETGIDLSQKLCLNNCRFDIVAGSKRNKEGRTLRLHEPPRGARPVRLAGGHKRNEEH